MKTTQKTGCFVFHLLESLANLDRCEEDMVLLPKPAHPQPLLLHWSERDTCIKISKICCVLLRLLSLAPSFFLDTLTASLLFCLKSLSTPDCSDERVKQFCLAVIFRVKKQDCPTHWLFTYLHLKLYWPEKSTFQLPSADISFCKAHFQTASSFRKQAH